MLDARHLGAQTDAIKNKNIARRQFLNFLAASPLLAAPGSRHNTRQLLSNVTTHSIEDVIAMLNAELARVMGQMGATSLKDIGPQQIGSHS